MLDDAGGGYWIAREALRRIWRREDEQPGVWRDSPMARALFAMVGGDSSIFSARFLMEKERGEIGMLARVVAEYAHEDALAAEILRDAGVELARLANAMLRRYGERKVVVAGRASQLHPLIESTLRQAMPVDAAIEFRQVQAHIAAARLAAEKYLSRLL
jgi:N-acetylglucosamine kinase-like BadF-type ATPase